MPPKHDPHHEPDPDWEPDMHRVVLALDLDLTVLTTPPQDWAPAQLRALIEGLHRIGITATPVTALVAKPIQPL